MTNKLEKTAKANADFAEGVIGRAAQIISQPRLVEEEDPTPAIEFLQQARDEFINAEPKWNKNHRTYRWPNLLADIGNRLKQDHQANPETWTPIDDFQRCYGTEALSAKLESIGPEIGEQARLRTMDGGRILLMNDKEIAEHVLMQETARFLERHGLKVEMCRDWEDPSAPLDYQGTVDGETWAFELTQMREEVEESHIKIGHPKERRTVEELWERVTPIPENPDGPKALQQSLDKAIKHGKQESKLGRLNGAKYCLVILNKQFLFRDDWEQAEWQSLDGFNAVLVVHEDIFTAERRWEVKMPDAFGKPLPPETVERLASPNSTATAIPEGENFREEEIEKILQAEEKLFN